MATHKFIAESPYIGIDERTHHASDYKYQKYLDNQRRDSLVVKSSVRVALFGIGRAGSIHLANIIANPGVELAYVVESDSSISDGCRTKWNLNDTTFLHPDDVSKVYEDSGVDASIICTPTFTHEEYIMGSLKAGKDVFCEKPISKSDEGTAKCYEMAKKMDKTLFCAFNRRFDPSFRSVYDKVRAGAIGHVNLIKCTSRDSPLPSLAYLKISGGIFHDCAVHDIDLATWVLGEYPTEVYSAANSCIPEIAAMDDFDNVTITMKFPSGSLCLIDLCRYANYGYDQRMEAFGPKGMICAENTKPNAAVVSDASGASVVPMYYSFPSRHSDGYRLQLDSFLDVVNGRGESSVTDKMTIAISRIADACEKSARTGKPITLEWKADEIPSGYVAVKKSD